MKRFQALLSLGTLLSLLLVTFVLAPIVYAASEGPNSPDTGAEDASIGAQPWTSVGNILASDNSYATAACGVSSPTRTRFLKATDFDFAIPSGATINGILVEAEQKVASATPGIFSETVQLVKGGTISGNDNGALPQYLATTDTYGSWGSSTDLWGLSWTDTDINSTGFGFAVSYIGDNVGTTSCTVDHMRATVYYTAGGAPAVQTREVKVISIM